MIPESIENKGYTDKERIKDIFGNILSCLI